MSIPTELVCMLYLVWLVLAVASVSYLADRKTDTRALTIGWGVLAALVPIFGLLFVLALLLKDDRRAT